MKALSLHNEVYKKRWALRVTTCGKRTKRSPKPNESTVSNDSADANTNSSNKTDSKSNHKADKALYPTEKNSNNNNKKRKHSDNADFALKRIKLKVM